MVGRHRLWDLSAKVTDKPTEQDRAYIIHKAAGYVLVAMLFAAWGFAVAAYQVFPWSAIEPIKSDLEGFFGGVEEGEQLTLVDKIANDFFDRDTRFAGRAAIAKTKGLALAPLTDPQGIMATMEIEPQFYSSHDDGYYLVQSLLNGPDAKFGGLLFDARGTLIRAYERPRFEDTNWQTLGQGGFTEDGLVIMNSYRHLYVTDFCGTAIIEKPMDNWHHLGSGADGFIWHWFNDTGVKLDARTGETLQEFTLMDLVAANGHLSIFEPRLITKNTPGHIGQWKYSDLAESISDLAQISLSDPFHHNDIDVLSEDRAALFPDFEAGDLLLSFRSINLIVAIDPDTLKVKWYKTGEFSRQHDPDWSPDGSITLYDNQSHNVYSRILRFDLETNETTVALDGAEHGLFMFSRGMHQVDERGRVLLINNTEFAHFDLSETVIFYFTNRSKGKNVRVGYTSYISDEDFETFNRPCQ